MGPAGDTTPASKLHGAYDDQYLLRLVSQKGKPGIFAFETCLHDQGIARQGTCVSALKNLKGEPVPISIEVIASEQLTSKEVEILAAVKRQHRQYTAALLDSQQQMWADYDVVTIGLVGPGLVIGGALGVKGSVENISDTELRIAKDHTELFRAESRFENASIKLDENSVAFERFIATSEVHLKNEVARLSAYLGEYNDHGKITALRAQNKSVDFVKKLAEYNAKYSIFNGDMVQWLDAEGLPEPLRKTLKARGLSIEEYLRKPSALDELIFNQYGNNKQAFDEIVRTAMLRWSKLVEHNSSNSLLDSRLVLWLADHNKLPVFIDRNQSIDQLLQTDLRGYIARWDEFAGRFNPQDAAYKALARNYELNAVRIDSYDRLQVINQVFDDVAKGVQSKKLINENIARLMASRYNRAEGIDLINKANFDLKFEKNLSEHMLSLVKGQVQQRELGYLKDLSRLRVGKIAGIVAVSLGFGAMARVWHSHNSDTPADDHEDDWQALLESGQVDLITDFSSSLWTPDATEHATVPSVKELMSYLTLFQRELWFGATSDAPDVVQIVKHCLPQKTRGMVRARCESVVGLGT